MNEITPSRIQSADQNELTEIAYKKINVTKHFASDFQEFKASTTEGIDKIERLTLEESTPQNGQTHWSNSPLPTNCLSVFDHFMWLALKGLILGNFTEYETVKTKNMKQQEEFIENENNRLKMEVESLLKANELLSVQ